MANEVEEKKEITIIEEPVDLDALAALAVENEQDIFTKNPMVFSYHKDEVRPEEYFVDPLWGRQPWEAEHWFGMFKEYVNMPPGQRMIVEAWRRFYDHPEGARPGKSTYIYAISKHWRWKERAFAFDRDRQAKREAIWLERQIERREKDWNLGNQLREKAINALRYIELDDAKVKDILDILKLGTELQKGAEPNVGHIGDANEVLRLVAPEVREQVIQYLLEEEIKSG